MRYFIYIFLLPSILFSLSLNFRHYSTSEGLSSSNVTQILQDQHGFIWVGTYDGLNRFDGLEFRVYRGDSRDQGSLLGNAIMDLFEDSQGRLWISTVNGLNRYAPNRDAFISYPLPQQQTFRAGAIQESNNGQIYVVDMHQILRVDIADTVCRPLESFRHHAKRQPFSFTDMIWQNDQSVWLSSHHRGLLNFNPETGELQTISGSEYEHSELATNNITDLALDNNGKIWLATSHGLHVFDPQSERVINYQHDEKDPKSLSDDACYDLFFDNRGNLWIATNHGGINLMLEGHENFIRIKHDPTDTKSLNSNSTQMVYQDREQNLWVGTLNGISFVPHSMGGFETYRHLAGKPATLSNSNVAAFAQDRRANLWIGTDGGGLNYFDRKQETFRHFDTGGNRSGKRLSNSILCCMEDDENQLWIGGYLEGLSRFDGESFKHILHSRHGMWPLQNDDVRDILQDSHGDIWIATNGDGIFRFVDKDLNRMINYRAETDSGALPTNHCLTLMEDHNHDMWIGTYSGLVRYDRQREQFHTFQALENEPGHLSNNWVYALLQDKRGHIWVGTAKGLNRLDETTGTFHVYGKKQGFASDVINGILEDEKGFLWVSTNNGLVKFDPTDQAVVTFSQVDGLQGNEYNHGAYTKLSTGELVFGGKTGFSIFHPDSIREYHSSPPVILEKVQFLNLPSSKQDGVPAERVIQDSSALVLSYHQAKTFAIHYAAVEYNMPNKIRYHYHLDGYQDDWYNVGKNRSITFMNLRPGTYTLRIATSMINDRPLRAGTQLELKILPPWWQSPLAYLGYCLIICGALLLYHHYSAKMMRLRMDYESQRLEKEKVQELETLKSQFFTNISHEFRTPLTLILVPLREMLSKKAVSDPKTLKQQFKLMQRSAERLLRLVNQVIDLNKIEAGRLELYKKEIDLIPFLRQIVDTFLPMAQSRHISLQFNSTTPQLYTSVDPDKIDIIIFNILSNAFKFTPDSGSIQVSVDIDDMVQIEIRDSGPGIPDEHIEHIFDRFYHVNQHQKNRHGAGIGLALSRELVELHNGIIAVKNGKNGGAHFNVCLPRVKPPIHQTDVEPIQAVLDTPENSTAEAGGASRPSILIVEDDLDLLAFLKTQLGDEYDILTAANGRQGQKRAVEHMPDMIISDVMMVELDGIEMCRNLKSHELTSHIPIILLTARQTETQQVEGLETGADDYLTKPFSLDILRVRIRNILQSRRQLRERFSRQISISPKDIAVNAVDADFIQRALDVVDSHIADTEFGVQAFAEHMGLSRAQLFRKIKAITDETPLEFIQSLRLKRAADLLEKTDKSISEIAYDVGFRYPNHFSKSFLTRFGMSPKDYRKRQLSARPRS